MPELPEVQCFVDALNNSHQNAKVEKIFFRRDDIRFPLDKAKLSSIFARGQTIQRFYRRGKQIVIETKMGEVFVSLGMSGYFTETKLKTPKLHEHVTLQFSDHPPLGFIDPRRFGFWKTEAPLPAADPLSEESLRNLFLSPKIKSSKRAIKDVLMDQSLIGGIGNIYALEALFRARIHPQKVCLAIKSAQWNQLAVEIPPILKKAIQLGGSTISTYRNLAGDAGSFQNVHLIYDREGQKCANMRCNAKIQRIVQGGRSSWFCPRCQKI